jgi:hypothetical protein
MPRRKSSAYLSRQHFENVENSCPIVRLRERGSPV